MKLPNGDSAIVDEDKLIEYVLNPNHRHGRDHAEVFRSALGVEQDGWWILYSALKRAAANAEAVPGKASHHGIKFEVRFEMTGPRGTRTILSVWMIRHGETVPRLVTCYVPKQ